MRLGSHGFVLLTPLFVPKEGLNEAHLQIPPAYSVHCIIVSRCATQLLDIEAGRKLLAAYRQCRLSLIRFLPVISRHLVNNLEV